MTTLHSSMRTCDCGQTWLALDRNEDVRCPACVRSAAFDAVALLGPNDDGEIWIQRTPRTDTAGAAAAFLAEHGPERMEGFGWDGPLWWKPDPSTSGEVWIAASPGEPGALELWMVRAHDAIRPVGPDEAIGSREGTRNG